MKMSNDRFFKRYRPNPGYGRTWDEFLDNVMDDDSWRNKIKNLIDSMYDNGQLEPVVVQRRGFSKQVLDGNHRSLVCYITGWDVSYTTEFSEPDEISYYSIINGLDVEDSRLWDLFSFPIPGGWMSSDLASSVSGETKIYWNSVPPENFDAVIVEYAQSLGIEITSKTEVDTEE